MSMAIKIVVGLAVIVISSRRSYRSIIEGLSYREDELKTTLMKLPEVLART